MDLSRLRFGTVHSKFKGFQYNNTKIEVPAITTLLRLLDIEICRLKPGGSLLADAQAWWLFTGRCSGLVALYWQMLRPGGSLLADAQAWWLFTGR
jgi:hypothetical protein